MDHHLAIKILFAALYLSTNLKQSNGAATLSAGQSLVDDGHVLTSPSQIFELGFFSPRSSSTPRFLGIWYTATPHVVVWVANRQHPLIALNGVLSLSKNANLTLTSAQGTTLWSSNSSTQLSNPLLHLTDYGNLVIEDNSKILLWQSFDNPSDTLLPGMKLLQETETPNVNVLTSWKSDNDPSLGEFSFGIVNGGLSQIITMKGKERRYRAIYWDGHFPGFPDSVDATWNAEVSSTGGKLLSFFQPLKKSVHTRLIMNSSGSFQRFVMDERGAGWIPMITSPRDSCDNYGWCGVNGVCRIYKTPECECLRGFKPKSDKEWRLFDWRSGCSRNPPLDCQKEDGFLKIQGVKFPDSLSFQLNTSMSIEECRDQCLKNCNCTAYADPYFRNETNCLMWFGDLIDIREQAVDTRDGPSVYIRVAATELDLAKKAKGSAKTKFILIAVFTTMLVLVSCLGGLLTWRCRKQGYRKASEELELPLFDLATIVAATNNFSGENMLGEGGFGPVYKGNLSAGKVVAVKRMSRYSGQGDEEFKNEIILISNLQHRNLVRILGCCIEGEEKMLVYEYMLNKSLDYYIFDQERGLLLDWSKRFEIIMGIARGLMYLHHDSRLKIIHRDLKTSNILLDESLNAKISDFGIARMFGGDQTAARTKRVVGTYGYMAPEYAFDGKFSMKSDVFSMGVVILEIVSGKRNRGFKCALGYQNLLEQAWLLWKENRELELMDPCYNKSSYVEWQVRRCIQVGLLCVQNAAEERPMMPSVVLMLSSEDTVLPQPKRPVFFMQSEPSNENKCNSCTVTISEVQGR
ncbi:G-type lectin S-receptor-like serine/threonine-protein kinase SD1-1 isoform X2 [Salvia divinorum]|uniref:Receptor-like serine/threonine-protein kinase n=1 Tax=Salvia divinorum TaxID=28513 RepID=A0ABD1I3A8_SALDI